MRRTACLVLILPALWGCAKKMAPSDPVQGGFIEYSDREAKESDTQRLMIRSGSLDLRVKNLDGARSSIEEIVEDVAGRIDSWSTRDDTWLEMNVRVPEPRLDETMERLSSLGKVVGRSLRSRDVTEEVIDLEARLRNLRALRDRLRSYLEQAENLEEILKVERELARVQTEIESIEGRLKLLKDQVAMSELNVTVRKKGWL